MNVLVYLMPAALLLGLLGLGSFLWSLKSGQYDDLDGAALRILDDDDVRLPPPPASSSRRRGSSSPPPSVAARRDEFDDFVDVPVRAEIAGDGHEDIGPVSGRAREHVFVERDSGREVFGGQFLAGGFEQRLDAANGWSGRRRRR